MANYRRDDALAIIGRDIIAESYPELADLRIEFMKCDEDEKTISGTPVYAKCTPVGDMFRYFMDGVDYIITVYPILDGSPEMAMRIVLEYELLHIAYDGVHRYIKTNDLNDFMKILSKYKLDWWKF